MKRISTVIVACGLLLSTGCGEEYDAVIGVSVMTFDNPFFKDLGGAIEREAAKHNYKVIMCDGAGDPVKQSGQVDDFITKQVDAIILCPCDCKAVGATIAKANKAGIPVFTADLTSLSDQGEVTCHVATDNLDGGRKAAEAMIELLGGSGKVAVLDFKRAESCELRMDGFNEVISKATGIEVLKPLPGGGDRKKSADAAATILETHRDLDAFFCVNDPSAMGAVNAIERAKKEDQVRVVGFDAQAFAREAVREGRLYATIVQYPKEIGRLSADAVHRHLIGEEVEPEILIPVKTYSKATADAIDAELKGQE
ncbi:MAG: substrate-binding domain-containing protein [Candidatus Nealsonbacteria bacterium]|nr:substrate-binding domain-containing protein [Candidatus Nealsonbacteria bacterium]